MARKLGVSQPQLHNVLKGERKLQTGLADQILCALELSALTLFTSEELDREQAKRPKRLNFDPDMGETPFRKKPAQMARAREVSEKAG